MTTPDDRQALMERVAGLRRIVCDEAFARHHSDEFRKVQAGLAGPVGAAIAEEFREMRECLDEAYRWILTASQMDVHRRDVENWEQDEDYMRAWRLLARIADVTEGRAALSRSRQGEGER